MRISDWSSDVCSSDLLDHVHLFERNDHGIRIGCRTLDAAGQAALRDDLLLGAIADLQGCRQVSRRARQHQCRRAHRRWIPVAAGAFGGTRGIDDDIGAERRLQGLKYLRHANSMKSVAGWSGRAWTRWVHVAAL